MYEWRKTKEYAHLILPCVIILALLARRFSPSSFAFPHFYFRPLFVSEVTLQYHVAYFACIKRSNISRIHAAQVSAIIIKRCYVKKIVYFWDLCFTRYNQLPGYNFVSQMLAIKIALDVYKTPRKDSDNQRTSELQRYVLNSIHCLSPPQSFFPPVLVVVSFSHA